MGIFHEQHSEVARLLDHITREYEAAQYALSGLAEGTSRHQFITKRMENIAAFHSQLHTIVGDETMPLIATWLDQAAEEHPSGIKENPRLQNR